MVFLFPLYLLIFICFQMIKQHVLWTAEEDAIISILHQQKHIEDWEQIARLAHEQYHLPSKPSRLYKERYMNHLNPSIFKIDWSHQEQLLFMKLHNQIGNRWAAIAQHLSGKTDNCVKNHFYSKLRKLLRKLNKIIQFYLKKQFRPIDISIMYKIVQAAEERFKDKPNCDTSVSLQCLTVQNQMLQFAMFKEKNQPEDEDQPQYTQSHIEEYKQLIKEIYRVSKLYKRKSKKVRNSLIQAPVNHTRKKTKKDPIKVQDSDQSQFSLKKTHQKKQKLSNTILVKKQLSQNSQNSIIKKEQKKKDFDGLEQKKEKNKNFPTARIQVEEGDGIQQLLRTAGILHDEVRQKKVSINDRNSGNYISSQQSIQNGFQGNNQGQQSFMSTSNIEYSPLQSFTSQQMESFLGFPIGNNNNCAKFTLSQKSSFKSYSERDPSQIDNPFFDEYSSNNGRMMFPMNFNMPTTQQYQQGYNGESGKRCGGYEYGNGFFEQKGQSQREHNNGKKPNQ